MITHVFNSSIVSGPEMLVIPALKKLTVPTSLVFLVETRLSDQARRPIEYAKAFGHTVYSVPVKGRWDPAAFRGLRKVLDQISPRIVHAHDVKASLYVLQAKKQAPRFLSQLISTHHGAAYRKGKIRLYEEFYVRRVLPHFDRVLCVCQGDWQSLIRRGLDRQKVFIHLNGADRKRVLEAQRQTATETIRRRWKAMNPSMPDASETIFLGAVARLSCEKRHDRMISFLGHLKRNGFKSKTVLVCFGEGPELNRLQALAKRVQVSDQVFWMGYSKTISEEMAGFDLILSVSDGEGIPISLLEAGWAGTPAFATKVGGIPDLISSSEVGFLVDPKASTVMMANHLQSALEDASGLRKVGLAFQERVSTQFSEAAWLNRLNEIYQLP